MKKKISKKKNKENKIGEKIIKKKNNLIEHIIPSDFKLNSMKEYIEEEMGIIQYFELKNDKLEKINLK